uniref:Glycoside hydrolase family 2 catalytic domain-containing protein n=1 Tax=Timema poppense TaxID=170557 RepID=A0A7R9D057_TIMPO|nr:unnamed protein product [Timema poppensis]
MLENKQTIGSKDGKGGIEENEFQGFSAWTVALFQRTVELREIIFLFNHVQYMDIICVNRYRAWYSDPGRLDLISYQVERELTNWHDRFKKPVLVTEYGAGAISGMHVLPAVMWTEDYLMLTLKQHFPVFDKLRGEGFLLGEMIWNFADFQTPQGGQLGAFLECFRGKKGLDSGRGREEL